MMQGLGVQVENFHSDLLISIFETNMYEGKIIPIADWSSSQVVDLQGLSNFILISTPPNDRDFPTYINSKTGTNSNKETNSSYVDQYNIFKRVKYYRGQANSTTISIRLYKVVSTLTHVIQYMYHYQIKKTQDRNVVREANQTVMYNILQNPHPFLAPRTPQISSIIPNSIEHDCGKMQTVEITGIDLFPTEGFLYPQNLTTFSEESCIRLTIFVTPGGGFKSMIIRFSHPLQLADRFYYPVFKINDTFISFNQCLIEFTDTTTILGGTTITNGYGMQHPFSLPDALYPPSGVGFHPLSLMDSISFGSPRSLCSLSSVYPDGLPYMFAKVDKCFSKTNVETKAISLIDLATHFGELCTLLYLVVWHLETCGIITERVRTNLDKFILQAKQITYNGMMENLKVGSGDTDSNFHSEKQLRELASQMKDTTQQQNKYINYSADYYVSYTDKQTLEAYFTNDVTPNHLVDPITGVLYNFPVILPSGNTVSIQLASIKPRFDIFSSKPFEANQNIVLNRYLIKCVDEYIGGTTLLKIQEMGLSVDKFKEVIYILSLLQNKRLNSTALVIKQFSSMFWSNLNVFLPFITQMTKKERIIQYEMLLRGSFPREVYITRLLEEKSKESVIALCKLFPTPMDAYETLNLRQMLSNSREREIGISIVFQFLRTCAINLLEMYLQQQHDGDEPYKYELIECLRVRKSVNSL